MRKSNALFRNLKGNYEKIEEMKSKLKKFQIKFLNLN